MTPDPRVPAVPWIDGVDVRLFGGRILEDLRIAGVALTGTRPLPAVRIRAGANVGYGEAPPLPTFTGMDAASTLKGLRRATARIVRMTPEDALRALHAEPRLPAPVRCALDVALHDLTARALGLPLDRLLGARRQDAVRISRALGFAPRDELVRRVLAYRDLGVTAFKVKVGRDLATDLEAIAAVRTATGGDAEIAIDANASLTEGAACDLARAVRPYGVAYFEQPVARDDLAGLRAVRETGMLVMADESAFDAADVARLAEAEAVDLIGVKLIKCGGLAPAMELLRAAERSGLPVAVIDPLGSAISLHAGLALAVQIEPHPFAHGLSAGFAVDAPFAPHRAVIDGRLAPSEAPGLDARVAWPTEEEAA